MKKLFGYLRDYKKECVLGPLFKLLEAAFELLVPLVMAAIIDNGIGGGDRALVLRLGGVLAGLGLVGLASSVTAQYFAAKAAVGFAASLRHALFGKIQSLSFDALDSLGGDTLITRMTSDINQVQTGVNLALRLLLRSPFIVFGAMIMALTIHLRAALIFAAAIAALGLVVFGIMLWSIPRYRTVQRNLDAVLGITRENLAGVRVLRAFNKQADEVRQFDARNQKLTRFSLFVGRISALMNPLTYVLINLALLVLIQTGAVQVNLGVLTQGQVVALVNYMSQILVELVKMANLIITITRAWACGNRVQQLLEVPPASGGNGTAEAGEAPAVAFEHVCLTYPNAGGESLSDISFTVPRGSVFGIIGGTGSGKSSLVSLIPGFYKPTGGAGAGQWPENDRLERRCPAIPYRDGPAESAAVPRDHPGKPALGKSRRNGSPAAPSAGRLPIRRVCGSEGTGAGNAGGAGRTEPVGRAAPAPDHCPGGCPGAGNPDPGRQRLRIGFCDGRKAAQSTADAAEYHGVHRFPAHLVHPLCGSNPGIGRRPRRRARHARGTAGALPGLPGNL